MPTRKSLEIAALRTRLLAGTVAAAELIDEVLIRSGTASDQINFDDTAARQERDPDVWSVRVAGWARNIRRKVG